MAILRRAAPWASRALQHGSTAGSSLPLGPAASQCARSAARSPGPWQALQVRRWLGVRTLQSPAQLGRSCLQGGPRGPRSAGLLLRAAGGSTLLLAGVWASGADWGIAAVRCEDAPLCQAHAAAPVPSPELAAKPRASNSDGSAGVVRTALAVAGALACWSILVAAWAVSIAGPVVLVVAAATARWRLVGALCAATALPHIVPIPRIPGACEVLVHGIFRWIGPPGTVRFVDYSRPARSGEPEPEPPVAGDADRQLFCYHPHGIYTLGCLKIAAERPDVTVLSSPFLYHFAPAFRFIVNILKGENFGSVGRKDLMNIMKKGRSPLMLVPGGFHEATIVCPGTERVYLKNRKGFVKYALRHGYDLVPCYTIGESDLMANPQGAWGFRFFMNALSLPAVLPWGFPLLPLLPRRGVEMVTTVGPPVKVPRIRNPTDEDVKEYHKRYMAALQELYDRAKVGTASESRKLEIW